MERRLAAILAADVVGYSRLMGEDEVGTLGRLNALREGILEPLVAEHRGRIFKLMGDGLLVEFASVVDAVTCALAWQNDVAAREAGSDSGKPIRFRIGINLGDVIVEGDDIHGDSVNIAARLEGLAKPGGICLSDDAVRHARGKVEANFEDLGEQQLKNISGLVQVYQISLIDTGEELAPPAQEASPFPDRPTIAVLPLTNMTGDPNQEFFSDGITEDIITELSRLPILHVVARHASFAFKGEKLDIREIERKLGAHYVVVHDGNVGRIAIDANSALTTLDAKAGDVPTGG